jgi:hypothetical protein
MGECVYAQSSTPFDQILKSAEDKKLSNSRQWLKLLHIERNWLGIKNTQVTSKGFFLSDAAPNSKAEMEKTLAEFTRPAELYAKEILNSKNEKIIDHSEHPVCKFPARFLYLQENLKENINFWNTIPKVNCSFLKIYLKALDAKSVSFVFSSYFSDSPGSAFGHTFFRINKKSNDEKQELLDFGIGYAAQVSVDNPVAYALLGLVGGFRGIWTNLPYYYKVREYNDFEARDLWSYDLNLKDDELNMLMLHIWEVGSNSYTYYFFTQNCAFHMLTLLEAAAPRLHLIDHVPFYYVIPADSMKTLFFEKNLVTNITYRPSIRKIFDERMSRLDPISIEDVHQFAKDYKITKDLKGRTEKQYAEYLDTLLDLTSLRFPDLSEKKNQKMYLVKEDILKSRSEVNFISEPIILEQKDNERPDLSHGSSRFSINYINHKKDLKDELGVSYRFAIHDLLDNSIGLPENSQLEFFNLEFKKIENEITLYNFNLFKVLNLNPINFYEKKLSWGLKLGSKRFDLNPDKSKSFHSTGVEAQVGYSFELTHEKRSPVFLTMARGDLGYANKIKNNHYGYESIGFQLGLLKRFNNQNALLLTYEKMFPYKLHSYEITEFEFRSSLTINMSIGLGFSNKNLKAIAYYYF